MFDTIPQDTPTKQCAKCKQTLPIAAFSKHKSKLRNICRTCASEQYKAYYQTHREERRVQYTQWEQEHKKERRAYHTQYNHNHAEEHRIFAKQYYHQHPEERREYRFQYNHSAHGKQAIKAYEQSENGRAVRKAVNHKRRIAKEISGMSFTAEQFQEQLKRQHYRCYYCCRRHTKKNFVWHAEHVVPVSKGGNNDISNIVAACPSCNQRKSNKLPHEWFEGGRLL